MHVEFVDQVGPSAIRIAFQRMGGSASPPVLLIMGAGAQLIAWPDGFCRELMNRGLQLIRFDNRDSGLSTHFSQAPKPDFAAVMRGDFTTVTYTLSDMAADTVGLMDVLGLGQVHLMGASMGGMIAQTIAIEFPGRVRSLTSIMSTTGNPAVGKTDYMLLSQLGAPPPDRPGYIEWRVRCLKALGSPTYPFEEQAARELAGISWDRDHDPLALARQSVAVLKSGDRTPQLRQVQVPTLVIHGKADRMIDASGGIATANAIPHARLVLFEAMGHSLPAPLWADLAELVADHVQGAESVRRI
ncbi:MAG TPA: alpha/beta hydrolase [Chitinophagaceae bacterium]|nr:alpha/beta hydrolase [Chitinophagaceae bacterium]